MSTYCELGRVGHQNCGHPNHGLVSKIRVAFWVLDFVDLRVLRSSTKRFIYTSLPLGMVIQPVYSGGRLRFYSKNLGHFIELTKDK